MKRILTLASLLVPTLVFAEPPAPDAPASPVVAKAEQAIQQDLIKPLAARELHRSRFSRARMPATARRVRVIDSVEKTDNKGLTFVTFAVDAKHGWDNAIFEEEESPKKKSKEDAWRKDAITGCVYLESGEVFVKQGETFRPASIMVGKKVKTAPEHTCQPQDGQLAKK